MRFTHFTVCNFKGIEEVNVSLSPQGAGIFTMIGLNESGKTTILEALNSFDFTENKHSVLYGGKEIRTKDRVNFIPKHKKANFTGMISIVGSLSMTHDEREMLAANVEKITGSKVDRESIPLTLELRRRFEFQSSDYKQAHAGIPVILLVKRKRGRKFVQAMGDELEWKTFADKFLSMVPEILYFPTFLFSQPERIFLFPKDNSSETQINKIYRQIFESVAADLSSPLDLQEHVALRVLSDVLTADKREQLDAALNDLSANLTQTIFEGWTKVFGRGLEGREVVLRSGVDDVSDTKVAFIEIFLREGGQTFRLSERSTGFRWFFSFVIFTMFRGTPNRASTLFLLDEPASNLHARAQGQLIESFRRIASEGNEILYTTHSHYMVNPDWLDQAFIVYNSSVDYEEEIRSSSLRRPLPTSVCISKYRTFVGENPDKLTYFQPVLDSLQIAPSRIDLVRPSILTEGKSDYLILKFGISQSLSKVGASIVPTRGATGMDELIGIFKGWGIPFIVMLDDDREGKLAAKKYFNEWHLQEDQVFTLANVSNKLKEKDIRGFLDTTDEVAISTHFSISTKPTKSQVQLFFSEMLAQNKQVILSEHFRECIDQFVQLTEAALKRIKT